MMPFEQFSGKPVLVTGGAGFIGSHLARALVAAGAQVRVLDNFSHGSRDNLAGAIEKIDIVEGDIRRVEDCQRAMRGRRWVFHLAALGSVPRSVEEPRLYNDVDVGGTLNILEAAREAGVERVVYSASSSAYGDSAVLPKVESMMPAPRSPYAVAKLAGEYYCRVYADVYGLSTACLRYFNVFGPRQNPHSQYAAVIPAFITSLLKGNRPKIYGDGEQTRDFCYVDNVVQANLLAATTSRKLAGESMNIACGERISLNAMLTKMQAILGTHIVPEHLPPRAGDVRDSLADITLSQELIGYRPAVMFAQGLEKTIAGYR